MIINKDSNQANLNYILTNYIQNMCTFGWWSAHLKSLKSDMEDGCQLVNLSDDLTMLKTDWFGQSTPTAWWVRMYSAVQTRRLSVGSAVSLQYSEAVMIWWLYIPARPGEKSSVLTTYLSCQCLFMINATKPKIMRRRSAWWVQGAMKWCLCKQGKQHFSFDLLVNWKIQQTWSVLVASRGISVSCV